MAFSSYEILPHIEFEIREEVNNVIGDRIPNAEDIKNCHYVMAFLAETLRFRASVPISIPHKTLENYHFGMLNLK